MTLGLDRDGAWYRPGERVGVSCSWRLEDEPRRLTVHLLWYTEGKGTQDVTVVAAEVVDRPGLAGRRECSLELPGDGPYSFAGTLIAVSWAVEAVVEPGGATERLTLLVGPRPSEVRLTPLEAG